MRSMFGIGSSMYRYDRRFSGKRSGGGRRPRKTNYQYSYCEPDKTGFSEKLGDFLVSSIPYIFMGFGLIGLIHFLSK